MGSEDYYDVIITCGKVTATIEPLAKTRVAFTSRKHECREKERCRETVTDGRCDVAGDQIKFQSMDHFNPLIPNSMDDVRRCSSVLSKRLRQRL